MHSRQQRGLRQHGARLIVLALSRALSRTLRLALMLTLTLTLSLALAACGGDDDSDGNGNGDPDAPPADGDTAPGDEPDATEDVVDPYEFVPVTPGVWNRSGLEIVTQSQGQREDTAYYFAEVRNDTGESIRYVEAFVELLDSFYYPVGRVNLNPTLNDIPPGHTFYVGAAFPTPDDFTDTRVWLDYQGGAPRYAAYYNLPVTVDSHGADAQYPYIVRGAVDNTSGQDLTLWVLTVALIGPDDDLVGMARGVLRYGIWTAGETATFEVPFGFIAVDPGLVTDVRVAVAGYARLPDAPGAGPADDAADAANSGGGD